MKTIHPHLAGHMPGDSFGMRMKTARERCGIKRKDAALQMGISPGQLGRIENGAVQMVSDPRTLTRAASLYGVSDVWLYAGGLAGSRLVPGWYCVVKAAA